jgi:hypothetical protein
VANVLLEEHCKPTDPDVGSDSINEYVDGMIFLLMPFQD